VYCSHITLFQHLRNWSTPKCWAPLVVAQLVPPLIRHCPTFSSLQYHVHIRHRRDYDEQRAVAAVQISLPGLPETWHVLSHESISQAQVTSVQVCLTLIFNTISCGLQVRTATNRINTVFESHRFYAQQVLKKKLLPPVVHINWAIAM